MDEPSSSSTWRAATSSDVARTPRRSSTASSAYESGSRSRTTSRSPRSTCLDSGGRSYGGSLSSPTSVMAPLKPSSLKRSAVRRPARPAPTTTTLSSTAIRARLDQRNERSFNSAMGRVAGVTAEQTRDRLLQATADVLAGLGYDGTRGAEIAAAAGVSNGALYSHFGSKAELLVGSLRAHGRRMLAPLFAPAPALSTTALLLVIGRWLPKRPPPRGSLVVEALVAARRDEDVA